MLVHRTGKNQMHADTTVLVNDNDEHEIKMEWMMWKWD